jgi:hypothetical protein
MLQFDVAALEALEQVLSSKSGMPIPEFLATIPELFERPISKQDREDCRMSRGRWKKFCDEICPVHSFLKYRGMIAGRIQFPLDDQVPDGWLFPEDGAEPIGIEVTIAMGQERYHIFKKLNRDGTSPSHTLVPNASTAKAFQNAIEGSRAGISVDDRVAVVVSDIEESLKRKASSRYNGYFLLVEAPIDQTERNGEYWNAALDRLKTMAASLPFMQIHVVTDRDIAKWGYQLK